METIIRDETPADISAIHAIESDAFGRAGEADLVDRLRDNNAVTLSLVAEQAGEIVGHILFSPAAIGDQDTAVALGPVAVGPAQQNKGIGSALIREGLERCRTMGHRLVFLVGHPTYYPRFGFQPALPLGFESTYVQDRTNHAHFMVIELIPGALAGKSGTMRFHPEFDSV